jgi:hypothetical protein
MIETSLRTIIQTRINFVSLIDDLSIEQLNAVPLGFNNSLIWNFGHILVTQQLLCYKNAGLEMLVHEEFINTFKKGTKPNKPISQKQYDIMKELSGQLLEKFIIDLKAKKFEKYLPYTTSYKIILNNIQDAIHFDGIHEAIHYGTAMSLKRVIMSTNFKSN